MLVLLDVSLGGGIVTDDRSMLPKCPVDALYPMGFNRFDAALRRRTVFLMVLLFIFSLYSLATLVSSFPHESRPSLFLSGPYPSLGTAARFRSCTGRRAPARRNGWAPTFSMGPPNMRASMTACWCCVAYGKLPCLCVGFFDKP